MVWQKKKTMVKRTLLLVGMMAATLVTATGMALAVSKVCPSGTTQTNPCAGTKGIDNLVGTPGPDYISGLAGNDKISAGNGDDTTDGGAGNDTYSYKEGSGTDTLIDSSGTDALNFSAVTISNLYAYLVPETGGNYAQTDGGQLNLASGTVVETVTGTLDDDLIYAGGAANTLRPGPGTGGAWFEDRGGGTFGGVSIPASSDTYTGFAASGYGDVELFDFGGTADKLVLPFASTDAYFEASEGGDGDSVIDDLFIATSATDGVYIFGQLDPWVSIKGHIEQIQFTDETITIGSANPQTQTLSAEAQVKKLNEASKLDEAEKQKRKEAAKKLIEEAKKKKAQEDDGEVQQQSQQSQQSPSSPKEEKKR